MASIFFNAGISGVSFNYCWDLYAFLKQSENVWVSTPWLDEYFELKIRAQYSLDYTFFSWQRFSSLYSCFNRPNSNIISFTVPSLSNDNFKKQLKVILNAVFGTYRNVLRWVLYSTVHECHWSTALNKAQFNRSNCGYSIRRDATESCYWIRKILQLRSYSNGRSAVSICSVSRLQINTSWSYSWDCSQLEN
jgi:hypothetical protein